MFIIQISISFVLYYNRYELINYFDILLDFHHLFSVHLMYFIIGRNASFEFLYEWNFIWIVRMMTTSSLGIWLPFWLILWQSQKALTFFILCTAAVFWFILNLSWWVYRKSLRPLSWACIAPVSMLKAVPPLIRRLLAYRCRKVYSIMLEFY